MINKKGCGQEKCRFSDPVYYYILGVALLGFMYMTHRYQMQEVYEYLLMVPSLLAVGSLMERRRNLKGKRHFILSYVMLAWIVILMVRRSFYFIEPMEIGLDFVGYLFAFPLASLLRDGDEKKALKIFAVAYLAAAAVLAMEGLLLVLDCLPARLSSFVRWDGVRLRVFWHPNLAAGHMISGAVFCTTFISTAKSTWKKLGLCLLAILIFSMIALTRCRTVIIVAGVYLGSLAFFMVVKHGKKWFLPGVVAAIALLVVFYAGATGLYEVNQDALLGKYVQQYEEDAGKEAPPITVDQNTGEIALHTSGPQGTLKKDLGTFNSRTRIWKAGLGALWENPSVLIWGAPDTGRFISDNTAFQVSHMHNTLLESLVGYGFIGFLIAVLFTLVAVWNCLFIFLKCQQDVWKRNVALLTLCILAVSMMEPHLFCAEKESQPIEMIFFLCAGYLAYWQEEDNQHILNVVRSKLSKLRK